MALLITVVALTLLVSGVCSLLESTTLSLTPTQVARLATTQPGIASVWQRFRADIQRPIAVILIINTAANTMGATLAGAVFELEYGPAYLLAFSLLFTYLVLQFAEVLPKTLGVRYNHLVAPLVAYPMVAMVKVLSPIVSVVQFINRPFLGRHGLGRRRTAALEELHALVGLARISNVIGQQEERIITSAARLSATPIRQVMIGVEHVTFLSTSMKLTDAIIAAHLDPHTRFPICEDNDRDNVVGYVNFKEMIYRTRTNPEDPTLLGIIRPVHFVTPDTSAAEVLRLFTAQHVHMAIVRDEQHRTLGLVTLEDIVEELVGDIEDEFDRLPTHCHALRGDVWLVGGGCPMAKLAAQVRLELDPVPRGTLSAWLLSQLGAMPQLNQTFNHGGFEFMIRRLRRGNIFEVAVRKL